MFWKKNQELEDPQWKMGLLTERGSGESNIQSLIRRKGYNQVQGLDYTETFSPPALMETVKVIMQTQ